MKKIMTVVAMTGMLILAGCDTANEAALIAQVRAIATQACAFVPTVETVLAIISKSSTTSTATQIADAICNAVTKVSVQRSGKTPTVNGVIIHGHFIR